MGTGRVRARPPAPLRTHIGRATDLSASPR